MTAFFKESEMRKIKIFAAIVAAACIFCSCSEQAKIQIDPTKLACNYTACYNVTITDGASKGTDINYTNEYTVKKGETLEITSLAQSVLTAANGEESVQKIQGKSVLLLDEEHLFMPQSVTQEFTNSANEKNYAYFSFTHDHSIKAGMIKTKTYDGDELKENLYSVTLKDQYFDKDSLALIIGTFKEKQGVIYLSSGNRDTLQTVRYEVTAQKEIATPAGTYLCDEYTVRPNTDFTVYSAKIYIDASTGICIMMQQDDTCAILSSINFNNGTI